MTIINPSRPQPTGLTISQAPSRTRVMRSPVHPFSVKHKPYYIQPIMIAPVLPGETMKNLLLQARAVTDPVKSPLAGWWLEHYFFYVPLRSLDGILGNEPLPSNPSGLVSARTDVENMLLDIGSPMGDIMVDQPNLYEAQSDGGVGWLEMCMVAIAKHFFRDSDEDLTQFPGGIDTNGLYLAHRFGIGQNSAFDSFILQSELVDDVDYAADANIVLATDPQSYTNNTTGVVVVKTQTTYDGAITVDGVTQDTGNKNTVILTPGSVLQWHTYTEANNYTASIKVINGSAELQEEDTRYRTYMMLRSAQLTDLTFEEYLSTFGVRQPKQIGLEPELIRYSRNWTYPSNTIDPVSGAPSAAASWAITERADKDRFFREPGFIVGCTIARPKVYISDQTSYVAAQMNDAFSWLPAVMKEKLDISIKRHLAATGPLGGAAAPYAYDLRDLLIYGDQFTNIAPDADNLKTPFLPLEGLTKTDFKYVDATAIDDLFVGFGEGEDAVDPPDGMVGVQQDGVVQLNILGTQIDNT